MLLLLLRVGFLSLPNYLGPLTSEVWRETLHQKESRIPSSCLWPIDTPFSSSFSSGSSLLPRSFSSRSWIDETIRRQWKSLTGVSGKELATSSARNAVGDLAVYQRASSDELIWNPGNLGNFLSLYHLFFSRFWFCCCDMVSRLLPSSCTSSLWSLSPSILCEPVKYDTQILNEKIQNKNIKQRKLLNVFASLR